MSWMHLLLRCLRHVCNWMENRNCKSQPHLVEAVEALEPMP